MKDATTAPLTRSQKLPNCWQIATQFILVLPWCAKYTMAAAAPAPADTNATTTCNVHILNDISISPWQFVI